jgi:protocatechuate 3,4-dioxygenase beta subunit
MATQRDKTEPTEVVVKTTVRGFFQITGIPAGDYIVRADGLHLGHASLEVTVADAPESLVPEPLRLRPPATVDVAVSPSSDFTGRPWVVELFRKEGTLHHVSIGRGRTKEGVVRFRAVSPGPYEAVVSDGDDRWSHDVFEVEGDAESLVVNLEIPTVRVAGVVRLGREPLVATVTFGGAHGFRRVQLPTNEKGEFAGQIPRKPIAREQNDADVGPHSSWRVLVEAASPKVQRTFNDIAVPAEEDDAWYELVVPNTAIHGHVVDELGRAVQAIVTLTPADGTLEQTITDETGAFRLHGLEPGEGHVKAESLNPPVRMADPVSAHIAEDSDGPDRVLAAGLRDGGEGEPVG